MNKKKVLFLCVQNSARSQMAEAILNEKTRGDLIAFSAGSEPTEKINPFAEKIIAAMGINTDGLRPKSIASIENEDFDFIFTLCDKMQETCPSFPGKPIYAHWGVEDPALFSGTEQEKKEKFREVFLIIANRINRFLNLSLDSLPREELEELLKRIGKVQ